VPHLLDASSPGVLDPAEPASRILLQAAPQQFADSDWSPLGDRLPVDLRFGPDRILIRYRGRKRTPAGEEFVEQAAERPDIGRWSTSSPRLCSGSYSRACRRCSRSTIDLRHTGEDADLRRYVELLIRHDDRTSPCRLVILSYWVWGENAAVLPDAISGIV
jgi:hypothetical protein